ncbi:MAG: NAD(P)H-hydrate epimerase, partial [Candidatus Limnocylindria bacterium]
VRYDADREDELAGAQLVLDGLLGYSGSGAPREDIAPLIRAANRSGAPILAIDLPSGLHPDTGEPLGVAIRAAVTVTLALPKIGLLTTPSRGLVGELILADIGVPAAAHARADLDAGRLFGAGDLVRMIR